MSKTLDSLIDWLKMHSYWVNGWMVVSMVVLLVWIFVDHYRNPNNRLH